MKQILSKKLSLNNRKNIEIIPNGVSAEFLDVSEATIRKDLTALDEAQQLTRVRGGAALSDINQPQNPILSARSKVNTTFKQYIARWAATMVEDGDSIESALKRFKRKVQQEAIIKEIKKHSIYYKPGEKRRMKDAQARKRMRRRLKREREFEYY